VAAGVLLRVAAYVADRSLWLDEAYLAATILRPFGRLFDPAAYGQIAPPGFLLLEHAAVGVFGPGELALRLPSLLAGIASLFLMRRVAYRLFPESTARLALFLFAFADPLVYFASELKPYALDVAIALFLLDRGLDALAQRPRSLPILAVAGAASVWFSYPSVFVLAALGATLAAGPVTGRARPLAAAATVAVWAASFAVLWRTSLRASAAQPWLLKYWAGAFPTLPPRSWNDLAWAPRALAAFLLDPGGVPIRGAGIFAGLVGLWYLARERPRVLALLGGPFLATLAAAALRRYPFYGRLVLFLVPFLLLILAYGADRVRAATARTARAAGVLLVALLAVPPAAICAYRLVRPRTREETKPVLAYLGAHCRPGDRLYLYEYAAPAFDYYARRYGLDPGDAARGTWEWDPRAAEADAERLAGGPRTWVLFSHTLLPTGGDVEDLFVPMLDARGRRLDAFRAPGAAVYLYDFRPREAPPERKEN